jgi:hypothetical protein
MKKRSVSAFLFERWPAPSRLSGAVKTTPKVRASPQLGDGQQTSSLLDPGQQRIPGRFLSTFSPAELFPPPRMYRQREGSGRRAENVGRATR